MFAIGASMAMLAGLEFSSAGGVWVSFVTPKDGAEVIGEIQVEAEVVSARTVREVVFYLDGRPLAIVTEPPYRVRVNLGEENRRHSLEVIATDVEGDEARESIATLPVSVVGSYEVDLQQLYVTVSEDEESVLGLTRDDFEIRDEGRRQQIVTFAHGDIPFTAVLLIDASASMHGSKIAAARAGATSFIAGMRELDIAKVIVFSDVIQNSSPFSGLQNVLTTGLIGATGLGGTALNDHLYVALKLLEGRQGRRVLVVLSDGTDHHSVLGMDQVSSFARRAQTLIYWIRIVEANSAGQPGRPRDVSTAWRGPAEYREQFDELVKTVHQSGGRIIDAFGPSEFESVFAETLRELREQYAIGYYPDNRRNDGSWHRVKVKVGNPELKVRTHAGYIDF
jgi:Ca-activated chloride channel family protein